MLANAYVSNKLIKTIKTDWAVSDTSHVREVTIAEFSLSFVRTFAPIIIILHFNGMNASEVGVVC